MHGIIDLRDVLRVRPSADASAPSHALDLVLRARTYVLVPQPATNEEVSAWVRVWAQSMRPSAIAPELRELAGLGDPLTSSISSSFRVSSSEAPFASTAASWLPSPPSSAGALPMPSSPPSFRAWPAPEVIMQGYLHKLPVRSEHRNSLRASSLLGELSSWRRRYFQLRPGMLQWYREDPGSGGEFLGVLRLTAKTSIDLERGAGPLSRGEARLKVKASGETLILKDDVGERLAAWEADLAAQVNAIRAREEPGGIVPEAACE